MNYDNTKKEEIKSPDTSKWQHQQRERRKLEQGSRHCITGVYWSLAMAELLLFPRQNDGHTRPSNALSKHPKEGKRMERKKSKDIESGKINTVILFLLEIRTMGRLAAVNQQRGSASRWYPNRVLNGFGFIFPATRANRRVIYAFTIICFRNIYFQVLRGLRLPMNINGRLGAICLSFV